MLILAGSSAAWVLLASGERAPAASAAETLTEPAAAAAVPLGEPAALDLAVARATVPLADAARLLVRARVTDRKSREAVPEECAGWLVRALLLDEASGAASELTSELDAEGYAGFVFRAPGTIRWVACTPPDQSILGPSVEYLDLECEAGSEFEALLAIGFSGSAEGRVVDETERPVAGARVHARAFEDDSPPSEWNAGVLQTTTDASGKYRFANLAAGNWRFAVEPSDWIALDRPEPGDINPGSVEVVDDLMVTRGQMTEIRVVDLADRGLPDVLVWATPLSFTSPAIRRQQERWASEENDLEFFLAGGLPSDWLARRLADRREVEREESGVEWPYATTSAVTDQEGRVRLPLARGSWQVDLDLGAVGAVLGRMEPPILSVPGDEHLIRVPVRTMPWRGRVQTDGGVPVPDASVTVLHPEDPFESWEGTETDSDGCFRFTSIPVAANLTLQIDAEGFLLCRWDLEPGQVAADSIFYLPRAKPTWILLNYADGEGVDRPSCSLRATPLELETIAGPEGMIAGRAVQDSMTDSVLTRVQASMVYWPRMPRGRYELTLLEIPPRLVWGHRRDEKELCEIARSVHIHEGEDFEWTISRAAFPPEMEFLNLRGIVRAANGDPVSAAEVVIWSEGCTRRAVADSGGAFAEEVPAGLSELYVRARGCAPWHRTLLLTSGESPILDIRMALDDRKVVLRLLDRDGEELPSAIIRFLRGDGAPAPVLSAYFMNLNSELAHGVPFWSGRIPLLTPSLGTYEVRAQFWRTEIGRATWSVDTDLTGQTVELRLDCSLEEIRAGLQGAGPGDEGN